MRDQLLLLTIGFFRRQCKGSAADTQQRMFAVDVPPSVPNLGPAAEMIIRRRAGNRSQSLDRLTQIELRRADHCSDHNRQCRKPPGPTHAQHCHQKEKIRGHGGK